MKTTPQNDHRMPCGHKARVVSAVVWIVLVAGIRVAQGAQILASHPVMAHTPVHGVPPSTTVFQIIEGRPGSAYPYSPATLYIPVGRIVSVKITDYLGGCALVTVFPGLAPDGGTVRARVPVGATRRILLRAPRPGRYRFHCSENMYFGTIIAR